MFFNGYVLCIYIILFDIVVHFKHCIFLYINNEWFCTVNFVSIEFLIPRNLGLDTKIIFLSELVVNYTRSATVTAAIFYFLEFLGMLKGRNNTSGKK